MPVRRTTSTAATAIALLLTAACSTASGVTTGTAAGEDPGRAAPERRVGIILPDTESSARWETADRPLLQAAFDAAGVDVDIQNAEGDAGRMRTIADRMIGEGVAVLAIVSLDADSGAAIQRTARAQGVRTIDYDRLTLGGSADYYVSFDATRVGELQGEGLARCLGEEPANIAYLNGSPTDNNATLFAAGAHSVLDPVNQYSVVGEQAVPEWDDQQAAALFEVVLAQAGQVDGVIAANDGLGGAAIAVLAENGLAGRVPVTGQDATVQGLQNILAGTQCMTVYKAVAAEAEGMAQTAIALIDGREPATTGTVLDGDREVASILLEPRAIFREDVKTVVDDGFVTAQELCTGEHAAACTELGIT